MKVEDARTAYYEASKQTSDLVRQLGFAAIAIIWLFRSVSGDKQSIPQELLVPTALVVSALALDLLQYTVKTISWGIFSWQKERRGVSVSEDFLAPRPINWFPLVAFVLKVLAVIAAYVFIGIYVGGRIM
jgi:hypothetical protein